MTTDGASRFILVVLAAVVPWTIAVTSWAFWRANRMMPVGICKRLLRRRNGVVKVPTRYGLGAWNPEKPLGRGNRTPDGPGIAYYSLLSDGSVRVDVRFRDGRTETHTGPMLKIPPRRDPRSWVGWAVPGGYVVASLLGGLIGYATDQFDGAAIGVMLGYVSGYVLMRLLLSALRAATRRTAQTPH